jgi:streptogramin lyase
MATVVRVPSRRRRYLWLLAGACLLLVVVPWGTATAIRVVRGPDAVLPDQGFESLAMSPAGRTLYAESYSYHGPERLVPVDVTTGKAGRRVVLGVVEGMVITPDGRMLYTLLDGGLITPVDLIAGRAMKPVRVKSGAQSMAVSPDGRTLYVSTGQSLVAIDIATGRQQAPIPLPRAANPLDLTPAASGIAVTPDGRRLYVDSGNDTVIPVDLASGKTGTPVRIAGDAPLDLAMAPDGKTLWVAVDGDYDSGDGPNSLVEVNTATNAASKPTALGPGPVALTVAPDGRTLYILNDNKTITPVDTASGQLGAAIRTAGLFSQASPSDLAISRDGGTLYVAEGAVAAIRLARLSEGREHRARRPCHQEPVPLEYSIERLICVFAGRREVVLVSLPGAAGDRLRTHVPGPRPGRAGVPQ